MADATTFLITGVGGGLGAAFADAALGAGHRVLGMVRDPGQARSFEARDPDRARAVMLDLLDPSSVSAAIDDIAGGGWPVDVLVNNAGYGHEGVVEESPLDELRDQFEVNLFAPVALIRAVLPGMRARRRGHIVNVTSMAGTTAFPGLAYYSASKFALDGLSEALAKEVRPLGIFVTSFAPGQFRTEWAGRSMRRSPRAITDYDGLFDPLRAARQAKSGFQPGDPVRAARALLAIVGAVTPPSRIHLGSDALALARQKLKRSQAEITAWEELSLSTDFGGDADA